MKNNLLKFQEYDLKIEGKESTIKELVSAIKYMSKNTEIELPKTLSNILYQMETALKIEDLKFKESYNYKNNNHSLSKKRSNEDENKEKIDYGFNKFDSRDFYENFHDLKDCKYLRIHKSSYNHRVICFELKLSNTNLNETLKKYSANISTEIGSLIEEITHAPGYRGSHYTITPICVKVAKDVSISDLKNIFFKIKNILEKNI